MSNDGQSMTQVCSYGAEFVRTAGVKLGYWRWKFLNDAVDLDRLGPVALTALQH